MKPSVTYIIPKHEPLVVLKVSVLAVHIIEVPFKTELMIQIVLIGIEIVRRE
jgi:hypothetical protein